MATSFRNITTGGISYPDGNTTLTKPSGVVSQDLLIAIITVGSSTAHTFTPPSGWVNHLDRNAAYGGFRESMWYKIAGGSEPADYNFVISINLARRWQVLAYSGADTTTPLGTIAAFSEGGGGNAAYTTMEAPSVTAGARGKRLLCHWSISDQWDVVTATVPGSMTQRYWQYFQSGGELRGTLIGDEVIAGGGATGQRVASQQFGNAYNSWSVTINEQPASARASMMVVT